MVVITVKVGVQQVASLQGSSQLAAAEFPPVPQRTALFLLDIPTCSLTQAPLPTDMSYNNLLVKRFSSDVVVCINEKIDYLHG